MYLEESDHIFVVAPCKIAMFEPNKFISARKIIDMEFTPVIRYLDLLKPKKVYSIPFNPSSNDWMEIISDLNL